MTILDDIQRLASWMDQNPIPQSIWFIDRDRAFRHLRTEIPTVTSPYTFGPSLGGLRCHSWHSDDLRARILKLLTRDGWDLERARRIIPFCQPGIWIQMSNGKHRHIEIVP